MPEKQISRQFLLTAQLVNFLGPKWCTPIGIPVTSQVLDINLDEYVCY